MSLTARLRCQNFVIFARLFKGHLDNVPQETGRREPTCQVLKRHYVEFQIIITKYKTVAWPLHWSRLCDLESITWTFPFFLFLLQDFVALISLGPIRSSHHPLLCSSFSKSHHSSKLITTRHYSHFGTERKKIPSICLLLIMDRDLFLLHLVHVLRPTHLDLLHLLVPHTLIKRDG